MSEQLKDLARLLMNPEKYGHGAMQDTIEFDPIEIIEAEIQADAEAEKERIRRGE